MMFVNFLTQHLNCVEERVNVQTLAIVLPLHVFEANLNIRLKRRTHFAEARYTSQTTKLVGRHQLRFLASVNHYFEELLGLVPYVVVIELSTLHGQDLFKCFVEIRTPWLLAHNFYCVPYHFGLYILVQLLQNTFGLLPWLQLSFFFQEHV